MTPAATAENITVYVSGYRHDDLIASQQFDYTEDNVLSGDLDATMTLVKLSKDFRGLTEVTITYNTTNIDTPPSFIGDDFKYNVYVTGTHYIPAGQTHSRRQPLSPTAGRLPRPGGDGPPAEPGSAASRGQRRCGRLVGGRRHQLRVFLLELLDHRGGRDDPVRVALARRLLLAPGAGGLALVGGAVAVEAVTDGGVQVDDLLLGAGVPPEALGVRDEIAAVGVGAHLGGLVARVVVVGEVDLVAVLVADHGLHRDVVEPEGSTTSSRPSPSATRLPPRLSAGAENAFRVISGLRPPCSAGTSKSTLVASAAAAFTFAGARPRLKVCAIFAWLPRSVPFQATSWMFQLSMSQKPRSLSIVAVARGVYWPSVPKTCGDLSDATPWT